MRTKGVFLSRVCSIVLLFSFLLGGIISAGAYVPNLTINELPTVLIRNQSILLTGKAQGACSGKGISISQHSRGKWTSLGTSFAQSGRWQFKATSPKSSGVVIFKVACGGQYPASVIRLVVVEAPIENSGPGNRIFGLDISRWQHISGKQINFADMAAAGSSFVIIKASDGTRSEDAIARKYVLEDAQRAKVAGLIVGYYHMVSVPATNSTPTLMSSAKRQGTLAATRLRELGGYDNRTLPYTLDMEGINSKVNQASLFIWTKTFIKQFMSLTHRRPIIYSYRSFLATRYAKKSVVRDYLKMSHLWLAQPGDPGDPKVRVGGLTYGGNDCFQSAWTVSGCRSIWTFWQYTNSGNRDKFGIPWRPQNGKPCPSHARYCVSGIGTGPHHLDLNVFNGTKKDLLKLTQGTWNRTLSDYLSDSPTASSN